jgi:hypothetical protein
MMEKELRDTLMDIIWAGETTGAGRAMALPLFLQFLKSTLSIGAFRLPAIMNGRILYP